MTYWSGLGVGPLHLVERLRDPTIRMRGFPPNTVARLATELFARTGVPPAIEAILSSDDNRVQGFLAAGHVCTVMGIDEYRLLVEKFKVPIVVTGFEPVDLLQGVAMCVAQLEQDRRQSKTAFLQRRGQITQTDKISPSHLKGEAID